MNRWLAILRYLCVVLIMAQALAILSSSHAAQEQPLCFKETGQCIGGEIRAFWQQNGGLPVFGFPLAPARPEIAPASAAIFTTQWFERERLELHPENAPPYRVLLGRLGDQRLRQAGRDPASLPKASPSAPHYFSQTGHAIAEQFWGYWRGHGLDLGDPGVSERESIALFGYPISEAQQETISGRAVLTQWFERTRFEYHPNNPDPHKVLLGLLGSEMAPTGPTQALDRINFFRRLVGVPPIGSHPSLIVSAQSHANYLALNGEGRNAHLETPGRPGFTGASVLDRVKAAGYGYPSGYRVNNLYVLMQDPVAAINALIDLPLHRVALLDPQYKEAGYGSAVRPASLSPGSKQLPAYSVLDLGSGPLGAISTQPPAPIAYPTDKQSGIPTGWFYYEFPDPLPPGTTLPIGYPFTIQGAYGQLRIAQAEMRDPGGQVVPAYPNPAQCANATSNCHILLPRSPLRPHTTYTVRARGSVANSTFDQTWQFTTGPEFTAGFVPTP